MSTQRNSKHMLHAEDNKDYDSAVALKNCK